MAANLKMAVRPSYTASVTSTVSIRAKSKKSSIESSRTSWSFLIIRAATLSRDSKLGKRPSSPARVKKICSLLSLNLAALTTRYRYWRLLSPSKLRISNKIKLSRLNSRNLSARKCRIMRFLMMRFTQLPSSQCRLLKPWIKSITI